MENRSPEHDRASEYWSSRGRIGYRISINSLGYDDVTWV